MFIHRKSLQFDVLWPHRSDLVVSEQAGARFEKWWGVGLPLIFLAIATGRWAWVHGKKRSEGFVASLKTSMSWAHARPPH